MTFIKMTKIILRTQKNWIVLEPIITIDNTPDVTIRNYNGDAESSNAESENSIMDMELY